MATSKSSRASETGFDKTINRVRDNVKNFATSSAESAAGGVGALADQGADGVKAMAHSVPQVQHWADDQIEHARDRVRDEPIKMMAIAAGVGALLGVLLLRR